MAIYRQIYMSFWTDPKIDEEFSPEDKYFYLYLLTNPHTNLCGCYEISNKQMADDTGYNRDTCAKLIERMRSVHKVIDYDPATKEVLLINWHKYNWSKSADVLKGVRKEIEAVKSANFRSILYTIAECVKNQTLYRPSIDPLETSVTVTVTDTVSATNTATDKNKEKIEEIVSYLNSRAGTSYRANGKQTASHINARLAEGYTVNDFITVIDKKCDAWLNDEKMAKYIRPETLFGSKFEAYLNERKAVRSGDRFMAELEEIYRSETYGE